MKLRYFLFSLLLLNVLPHGGHAQHVESAVHGHSHNDYLQKVPLYNAVELGYKSIEIDVYSYRSEIRVSHLGGRLQSKPRLEDLYLRPLKKMFSEQGSWQSDDGQITLMIDLKSDKYLLIPMLRTLLKPYREIIDTDGDHQSASAPLRIMLSGHPDIDAVLAGTNGIFCVDGQLGQLGSNYSSEIMPRVSADYKDHFKWSGNGAMPEEEAVRLNQLVERVHAEGRKLRFWNSPDNREVWNTLLEAGVDWINVDDLEKYSDFIRNEYTQKSK